MPNSPLTPNNEQLTTTRILFVCVHNAGRSQMAEAILNHEAKQRSLDYRASSAGTMAGSAINPLAKAALEEIGIPTQALVPKQLTQEMADEADQIITMGCGVDAEACPAKFLLTDDWGLDDPAGQSIEKVREIRDQIHGRVIQLLEGK